MNYQKKYLKYKQKYFNIKNQHGGDLANDVLYVHNIIKKLNQYSITIPSEIIQNLSHSLSELNAFYISQRIEEHELQQKHSEEETQKRMTPLIIVKILWINFFKILCDRITEYHHSIMNNFDESSQIRIADINQKLQNINKLLVDEWNYYLPPGLEDIEIPESNLTAAMLISDRYANTTYSVQQRPVLIGFRNPPRFIRKTKIPYNPETMDHIIFEINDQTEENVVLINISRYGESWSENGIQDISSIIEGIFNEKKYSDLELFFKHHEKKFINLEMSYIRDDEIRYFQLYED
jgi:hypothetical protein